MIDFARYIQWIGMVSIIIVGACLALSALMMSRPRKTRPAALLAVALVQVLAGFALINLTHVILSVWWMLGMMVAGLVVGWFVGRMTKVGFKDGERAAQLSPIAPWLTAIVYTAALAALFFAQVQWFVLMAQVVLFTAMLTTGWAVSAFLVIKSAKPKGAVASGPAPAAVESSSPAPEPTA